MNVAGVWWVEKDDVERWTVTQRIDRVKNGRADNSIALRDPAVGDVPRDEPLCTPVVLDERHPRRAPADSLDPDRTRSSVAIKQPRPHDPRGEEVKERLSQLVGGGPQAVPRGSAQTTPLQRAGNDPHTTIDGFIRRLG